MNEEKKVSRVRPSHGKRVDFKYKGTWYTGIFSGCVDSFCNNNVKGRVLVGFNESEEWRYKDA